MLTMSIVRSKLDDIWIPDTDRAMLPMLRDYIILLIRIGLPCVRHHHTLSIHPEQGVGHSGSGTRCSAARLRKRSDKAMSYIYIYICISYAF